MFDFNALFTWFFQWIFGLFLDGGFDLTALFGV